MEGADTRLMVVEKNQVARLRNNRKSIFGGSIWQQTSWWGVMTAAAVAWLIWAEMNSRRSTARQNAPVPVETAEVKSRQGPRNTLRGV